jgi:hypothetical protein
VVRLGVLAERKSFTDRPTHGVVISDHANSHHGCCPENISSVFVIIPTVLIPPPVIRYLELFNEELMAKN